MEPRKIATRIGFVVIVALVMGAVLAVGATDGGAATVDEPLTIESHQPDAILANPPEETGSLSVSDDAGAKHVVLDTGHGNDLDREAIAPMVEALTAGGHSVSFYQGGREAPLNESLRSADAFVVLSPEQSYSASERAGLTAFADAGGRVLLAGEPPSQTGALSVLFGMPQDSATAPMTGLAASFEFALGDGYVYDLKTYDNNYRNVYAEPTDDATVGADAGQVTVHEATTVRGGTPILETTETAKVSNDREAGSYAIASRNEDVMVIGDASLLNREWVQRNDNEVFVSGVLDFLVTGDKKPGAPAAQTPEGPGQPGQPTTPPRSQP
jgi:hypothetical protein